MLKTNIEILRDPVKSEWLIIDLGDGHYLPIHCYKDFERNLLLAQAIQRVLISSNWHQPDIT